MTKEVPIDTFKLGAKLASRLGAVSLKVDHNEREAVYSFEVIRRGRRLEFGVSVLVSEIDSFGSRIVENTLYHKARCLIDPKD
jgi:hypothetical protein